MPGWYPHGCGTLKQSGRSAIPSTDSPSPSKLPLGPVSLSVVTTGPGLRCGVGRGDGSGRIPALRGPGVCPGFRRRCAQGWSGLIEPAGTSPPPALQADAQPDACCMLGYLHDKYQNKSTGGPNSGPGNGQGNLGPATHGASRPCLRARAGLVELALARCGACVSVSA